jgi:putative intracellular protease/amidase
MSTPFRLGVPLLLVLALAAGSTGRVAPAAAATAAAATRYVCPPCGSPCDTMTFAGPGTCPTCGMALVAAGSDAAEPPSNQKKVAILVFDGVEILDYTGPYEMFGAANCDVYTVAATKDAVTTAMGMTVVPKYTFATAPKPDVLVVPGGGVRAASRDEPTLRYVQDVSAQSTVTMSVCNGAFILASAGLLDGLSATTTAGNISRLASLFPKVTVVRDRRYVDNGRIVTAAGLSAGIDGALHVIDRLFGTGYAQKVALADQQIPDVPLDSLGTWHVTRTEGDTRRWLLVATGTPSVPDEDLFGQVERGLSSHGWTLVRSEGHEPAAHTSAWRFTGSDGKPWTGTLQFERAAGAGRERIATLSIARSGG